MLTDRQLSLPGLRAEFMDRFNNTPAVFEDLTTRIPSTTDIERHRFLGSAPAMREWGTGRKAQGMVTESYDCENFRYEATISVDRSEVADDQAGQISIRIGELAERAKQHKDAEISRLLINGHSAGFHSYDGVPFFSGSHVSGKSGTQDNDITVTAANVNAPTVAELKTAIKSSIATLLGMKDDQGEPMNQGATGLTLVVPPATFLDTLEAISASIVANTSNVLQGAARVLAFPRITAPSVLYLLKTDVAVRPFIFQDREPIEFGSLEQDSETGFLREQYLYGVRARYRVTYGYFQRAVKVTFTP